MASIPPPHDRSAFEIAVICALSLEAECVYDSFDEIWNVKDYGKASGDDNAYTLGRIGGHNVILVHMPGMGTIRAAYAASNLNMSFPNIKLALVVGICGGMPYGNDKEEIALGDVVISKALVQYDFGKQYPEGFRRQTDVLNTFGSPSEKVLALLAKLEIRQHREHVQINTVAFLQNIHRKSPNTKYPGIENDILYYSAYVHQHHLPNPCTECREGVKACEIAIKLECEELGCETNMRVPRKRLHNAEDVQLQIHFGTIGSGNAVLKSGVHRDVLAQDAGIIAVEMEGAGVWRHGPSIVVKGVCDYADSHKRKGWQRYAAATAAACMKAFLMEWAEEERLDSHIRATSQVPINGGRNVKFGLCLGSAPRLDSSYFVGRGAELNQMNDILQPMKARTKQRRLILGGVGGIGKTQLAMSYAERHQACYDSVFWLNATSSLTLHTDIRLVAGLFLPPSELEILNSEQVLIRVHEWLSDVQNTKWLLIFDNYDEPTQFDIGKFCPYAAHGSVLVTTRLPDHVRLSGDSVRVQPLDEIEEGIEILEKRSQRQGVKNDRHARRLAQRLAGLPLALTTAGAYLSKRITVTFEQLLNAYEQRWNIEPRRPLQLQEYQDRTLYTTWDLSYARLKDDDPEAAQMLQLLAYFDNQCIWFQLLQGGAKEDLPMWLRNALFDQLSFDGVMSTLVEYCFVEVQIDTQSYSMHNCVHDWTLAALNKTVEERLYRFACDCIVARFDEKDLDALRRLKYARFGHLKYACLVPHATRLVHPLLSPYPPLRDPSWDFQATLIADMLRARVQLYAAEQFYLRILDSQVYTRGPNNIATLNNIDNLGKLYRYQGKLSESEKLLKQALAGKEKTLGADNISTFMTLNNLGMVYQDQGKLDEAEQTYLRALAGTEKILGSEHETTLNTVSNLGSLYTNRFKYSEAQRMYLQVLAVREKVLGSNHLSTLSIVARLGTLYGKQGKLDEAERLLLQVLTGCEKELGTDNLLTIDTVGNLGVIYWMQGQLDRAEQLLKRALAGYEKIPGLNHNSIPRTAINLGSVYLSQGRPDEAERMYLHLLTKCWEQLGPEHNTICVLKEELRRLDHKQNTVEVETLISQLQI